MMGNPLGNIMGSIIGLGGGGGFMMGGSRLITGGGLITSGGGGFGWLTADWEAMLYDNVATLALARDQGKGVARLRAYK